MFWSHGAGAKIALGLAEPLDSGLPVSGSVVPIVLPSDPGRVMLWQNLVFRTLLRILRYHDMKLGSRECRDAARTRGGGSGASLRRMAGVDKGRRFWLRQLLNFL